MTTDSRLSDLASAAFKALAKAGASDAIVGEFSLDLARVMGAMPQQSIDLVPVLEKAMESVIQRTVASTLAASDQLSAKAKKESKVKFTVTVNGHKTTVQVPSHLAESVAAIKGPEASVKAMAQEFAMSMPAEQTNRSKWVAHQMRHFVLLSQANAGQAAAH